MNHSCDSAKSPNTPKPKETYIFLAYDSNSRTWYFIHEIAHVGKYEPCRHIIDVHLMNFLEMHGDLSPKDKIVVYNIYGTEVAFKKEKSKIHATVVGKKVVKTTIFSEIYLAAAYEEAMKVFTAANSNGETHRTIAFYYGDKPGSGEYYYEFVKEQIILKRSPDKITIDAKLKIDYEVFESNGKSFDKINR